MVCDNLYVTSLYYTRGSYMENPLTMALPRRFAHGASIPLSARSAIKAYKVEIGVLLPARHVVNGRDDK